MGNREHPIFAKNLFLEFDGEMGRWGDGGKFIRSTIINKGQESNFGMLPRKQNQGVPHKYEKPYNSNFLKG